MRGRTALIGLTLAVALPVGVAFAGDDLTSLSYISYLERYATLQAARSDETIDAVINMPVLTGDRMDTARGARVEVQLADGSTVWVDSFSTLDFDALAYSRENPAERTVLYLGQGTVAIEIPDTALGDGTLRVDSPEGTVYLNRPGLYRLDLEQGQLHVEAHNGLAELPAGVGSALLRTGQEGWVDGGEDVHSAVLSQNSDDFWEWVEERRNPSGSGRTAEYVDSQAAPHAGVLDNYGDWVYVDTFSSWMWRPHVAADWTPYSCGRWVWTPVGWTWVSYEPWGWYPFHYGSWFWDVSAGWVWGWDSVWGPAWVHWIDGPGFIGWCPRGYYDWWYWHHTRHADFGRWPGHSPPTHWSEATLDFSGRVRLRDVDPRPWNIVPADQFASRHLERVRLDPSRTLRGGDGTGIVRSGPLLTPFPSPGRITQDLDTAFRIRPQLDQTADLGQILRRQTDGLAQGGTPRVRLRPVRTGDLVLAAPRQTNESPGVDRRTPAARQRIREEDQGQPGRLVFAPRGNQGVVRERPVSREQGGGTVRREVRPHDAPQGSRAPARDAEPGSRGTVRDRVEGTTPGNARPAPSQPAPQPRQRYLSWRQEQPREAVPPRSSGDLYLRLLRERREMATSGGSFTPRVRSLAGPRTYGEVPRESLPRYRAEGYSHGYSPTASPGYSPRYSAGHSPRFVSRGGGPAAPSYRPVTPRSSSTWRGSGGSWQSSSAPRVRQASPGRVSAPAHHSVRHQR
jgi:Family of unknown function (DUF6600)/FecR protein